MAFSRVSRRLLLGMLLTLAIFGIANSHTDLRVMESENRREASDTYIPNARLLRPLLLGHEAFISDLIWIRTLGYVGEQLIARKTIVSLEALVDLITDLDPRFEQVYVWAGAFLMYSGGAISKEKILASTRFLEKGWRAIQNQVQPWKHVSNYWLIPQMIGFNYAMELHDKVKGTPYFAEAAKIPGVPDLYKTLAATLYKKSGQMEEGTHFLETMLAMETLQSQLREEKDPEVQRRIRDRLEFYYRTQYGEKAALERIRQLEERIQQRVVEWRATYPYVPFQQYLLLRSGEDELVDQDARVLWHYLFPLSSAAIADLH